MHTGLLDYAEVINAYRRGFEKSGQLASEPFVGRRVAPEPVMLPGGKPFVGRRVAPEPVILPGGEPFVGRRIPQPVNWTLTAQPGVASRFAGLVNKFKPVSSGPVATTTIL